jgi:hypothetical protein
MSYPDRFRSGLIKKGINPEDLKNWKYAGGDHGPHRKYAILCRVPFVVHSSFCLCGHEIVKNCYITNGARFVVIGSCCIKRFISKNTRTCEKCGNSHRNRSDNRCHECRIRIFI